MKTKKAIRVKCPECNFRTHRKDYPAIGYGPCPKCDGTFGLIPEKKATKIRSKMQKGNW